MIICPGIAPYRKYISREAREERSSPNNSQIIYNRRLDLRNVGGGVRNHRQITAVVLEPVLTEASNEGVITRVPARYPR